MKKDILPLIFTVLVFVAFFVLTSFLIEYVSEVGLKNILMEIWEGER